MDLRDPLNHILWQGFDEHRSAVDETWSELVNN